MKINLTAFVFLSLSALTLSVCAKQKQGGLTIEDGVLSIGIEIGYPPMEYYERDGVTPAGFDIDLTKALAEKLGLGVKYIDTSWEGILAGLSAGRYDVAVNITILSERQKRYNFTKPYIDSSMTIVTLKDSLLKIERPEDIRNLHAGYQGDTTAQYFTERLRENGLSFSSFSYDKIINCFDDLKLGRLDLIVVDNIAAFDYAKKENTAFEVVWQGPSDEYIGLCLKKGNDTLTAALDRALDELFADGVLAEISQKYFKHDLVSSLWE
ncbi:MAG: ABC transporter substrate-binding protein [Treponema sp.]|jgi:polar amino acid transport system substrate-binding protein|nr:ABC transporter substrate-binding protein [Treponema sp.]